MKLGGMLRGGDLKSNASNFKKILFFLCFIVGGFFVLGVGEVKAAEYYVRADGTVSAADKVNAIGCSSADTALNIAQHNVATFFAGDTVVLCADGGDFTSQIAPPSSGASGNPITYDVSGQAKIDGGNLVATCFDISSKNYITLNDLEVTNCITDGLRVRGTSSGIVIRNVYSHAMTGATSQGFQTEGTAYVDYYNIQGDDNPDDGFSVHENPTINIYTGSFSGNGQGINMIQGPTFYAQDITISSSANEAIFVQGYHPDYQPDQTMVATFSNTIINAIGHTSLTLPIIAVSGSMATASFTDVSISNVPQLSNQAVLRTSAGAVTTVNGIEFDANSSTYGIIMNADSGTLALTSASISNVGSGNAVYGLSTADLTIERSKFSTFGSNIVFGAAGQTVTVSNSIFQGWTGSNYAINTASGGTIITHNNVFYNASTNGRGIGITSTSNATIKNNIFENLSYAVICVAGMGGITASHNILYGNTNGFYGTGCNQTSGISSDPFFVNAGTDFSLQETSPAIDSGTSVSLTEDYAGNPIYGLPDIGAYEYQPPYDMGTDEVDISANARIYGDGKFRNTETAGGTTADLSIIPQDSQTTKWLDISKADDEDEIIWESNHKKWKESSTTLGATETLHTVGDLTAGKAYSLRIDDILATANITGTDCSNGICTADEDGKITFTYTGGYSDHTFDITDDVAPIITITSPETGNTVSGDDTLTFTNTEPTNPQCSIDNSTWINCTSSVTSFSDLTNWDDIAESDTFTLYLRDTDGADNTGTANTANLTKADTQAPVRSEGLPSSELSSNTTSTTLSLTTSEAATCKYSATSNTAYADMTSAFADVDGTAHSATINGLTNGNSYNYYVRCQDLSSNANDTDYLISFSIASVNNDENTDEDEDNEKDLNIHNVKTESTENTITITWKTDHNTKSTIRYGTNKNLEEKKKDKDKERKHKVVLKNLQPNTKYYFRIKATDSNDNEDSSSIHSIATKSVPVVATSNQNVNTKTENQNSKMQESESQPVSTSSESATPNVCSYTVQQDDTLWSIAKQVYGDATAYPQIIEKNKDKYPDIESKLSIGQELKLCDNSQKQENSQNNSNSQNPNEQEQVQSQAQKQIEKQPETKTFQWWNPLSWF